MDKPSPQQLMALDSLPVRMVMFGSFYRGYYLLHEFLSGPSRNLVKVVGVATDDPTQRYVSPDKRLWSYPHQQFEETMVSEFAQQSGIQCYSGRIKTEGFRKLFRDEWNPDIVICGTFGQVIDEALFLFPRLGFYNTHPVSGEEWPSRYAGPNPFQAMINDGAQKLNIALHEVASNVDSGRLVALSEDIAIPKGVGVIDLHKITGPLVAKFVAAEFPRLLQSYMSTRPIRRSL